LEEVEITMNYPSLSYALDPANPSYVREIFKDQDTVFLFDFDGTITRTELLPEIAKIGGVNLQNQLMELTTRAVSGDIQWADSFRERVKLLSEISSREIVKVVEEVAKHEKLLTWIKSNRSRSLIVSGNLDIWIEPWLRSQGLFAITSRASENSSPQNRNLFERNLSLILDKFVAIQILEGKRLVVIGDGANDVPMMTPANFGIAFESVHRVPDKLLSVADMVVFEEEQLCHVLSRL
jgi:HAD superfamily phosphoserine phosphatase-like hydrolase